MVKSWSNILPERLHHFLEFERPCFPPLQSRSASFGLVFPTDDFGLSFESRVTREGFFFSRHAREPRSLIPGEIKPRRSKRGLHNGWRPNFQFHGQKESSTLKIEIDQSCRAAVYFFLSHCFPLFFLSLSPSLLCPLPFDSLIALYRRTLAPEFLRMNFSSMISRQVLGARIPFNWLKFFARGGSIG